MGTMLLPARSLATHCTRKRKKNPACAANPTVSQKGSSLNPHFHHHLCVVNGLFERVEEDTDQNPINPDTRLRIHDPTGLASQLLEDLQHTVGERVVRHFHRHGLLEPHDAEDRLSWDHAGGFSLDASVRIEATDLHQTPEFDPFEPLLLSGGPSGP